MTTFNWKVNGLQVLQNPEPNTVTMSSFTIVGTEGDITGSVTYSVNLLPPDPKDFTAFDQITQDMAVEWTKAALGEDRVAAMEAEVQASIDAQKVPEPTPAPLPWESQ